MAIFPKEKMFKVNKGSKNKPGCYVHICVLLAICAGFRLIEPPEGLTAEGLAVIGVFFATLYGWLFIDVVWPSLLGLLFLGLSTSAPMDSVLGSAFGNNTVLLLLFFSMVASIINAAGIAEWVARKIISVPFIHGRPYVLIVMLCLAMCALATMLTMTSAILVALPLVKEVCRQYGYKPGDLFPMLVMIAMIYVGEIAYMLLPFKSLPAIVLGVYRSMSGVQDINLAAYVTVVGSLLLISIGFIVVLYKYILKPDVNPILNASEDMQFDQTLSRYQKIILYSFVGLIILMMVPNIADKSWAITKILHKLGNNGLLLAYITLYLIFNFIEGISLKEIMSKSVPWSAIFLVIAVLELTGAFQKTGVTTWITEISQPLLAGFSGYTLVCVIIFLATLFTQFVNNNACAATFAPIAYTLAIANQTIDPFSVLTCLILSCTLGLATPASSTVAAIAYGDTKWVSKNIMFKYASIFWIFNVIMLSTLGITLCSMLY